MKNDWNTVSRHNIHKYEHISISTLIYIYQHYTQDTRHMYSVIAHCRQNTKNYEPTLYSVRLNRVWLHMYAYFDMRANIATEPLWCAQIHPKKNPVRYLFDACKHTTDKSFSFLQTLRCKKRNLQISNPKPKHILTPLRDVRVAGVLRLAFEPKPHTPNPIT